MRSKPMILVALLLAAFLVNLDTTLVNVALPAMVRELHATTTQLQWVADSFNLVFAALLLTFGSLSDRFGRKGMLLAGLTVFGTASLAGGFTSSPAHLIAARSARQRVRPGRGDRTPVRRRRVRGRRQDRGPWPPGPGPGPAARVRQRIPARPHYRLPRRRRHCRSRGRAGSPVPARPARPASEPGGR
jgi:Major Facilitator Superfamily